MHSVIVKDVAMLLYDLGLVAPAGWLHGGLIVSGAVPDFDQNRIR